MAERYALLFLLIAIGVFFSVFPKSSGTFPTSANISLLAANQTVTALVSLAVMFPLITGFFDFSVGANASLSSVIIAGLQARHGSPLWLSLVVAVVISTLIGIVNGFLVAYFQMNAFVTTLGASTLIGGVIEWYTKGTAITIGINQSLLNFGTEDWFSIPKVVYFVVLAVALCWYALTHTPFGRRLYSIGSNTRSARLVGIAVPKTVLTAFTISGFLAGLAGILEIARNGGATASDGTSLLFPALAAVFLGATAIRPGRFNVMGTIIGVLFVAIAVSGLTLSGTSDWVDPVFNGAALLVAVGLSTYLRLRRTGRDTG